MSRAPREHHVPFVVRSYEVEPDGRLRLVVLLRMLQEAAWQHAELLGKGFAERTDGAWFWVLSRLRCRMSRYPRWGDRFTVRTFPVGTEKMLAVREFSVHDEAGSVIGRAASGWLVVDGSRGRPVRPEPVVADIVATPGEYGGGLNRLQAFVAERSVGPLPVRYHDIDQYRHVNNASYLEWVIDALDPRRLMGLQAEELAVDFLKEALLDDGYRVNLASDRGTERFEVARTSDDQICARGYLRLVEAPRTTNPPDATASAAADAAAVDHGSGRR